MVSCLNTLAFYTIKNKDLLAWVEAKIVKNVGGKDERWESGIQGHRTWHVSKSLGKNKKLSTGKVRKDFSLVLVTFHVEYLTSLQCFTCCCHTKGGSNDFCDMWFGRNLGLWTQTLPLCLVFVSWEVTCYGSLRRQNVPCYLKFSWNVEIGHDSCTQIPGDYEKVIYWHKEVKDPMQFLNGLWGLRLPAFPCIEVRIGVRFVVCRPEPE
jgi:hypothetical protein